MYQIVRVTAVTPELEAAFQRLLPQLVPAARPLGARELDGIVSSPATRLLVARRGGAEGDIVAAVTVVVFRIPSGLRGRIESLVVDERARGQGLGEALCRAAIEILQQLGVASIDLTSNPVREAANRLYTRLGFRRRTTNLYRLACAPAA